MQAITQLMSAWCLIAGSLVLLPARGTAQVIINAPPTVIGTGFQLNSGEILNVGEGGFVETFLKSNAGSVVNITGGNVGEYFFAESGSEVNISGGTVRLGFTARSGSDVNISGGAMPFLFSSDLGSDLELIGNEYFLNGVEFTKDKIVLGPEDVFTGTLADGSTFIFSRLAGRSAFHFARPVADYIEDSIVLTKSPLPTLDLMPRIVDSPVTNGPSGLRAGQTLTVLSGGRLQENFAVVDATLNVEGGTVGHGIEVAGGTLNVRGGDVGRISAYANSEVNISGGSVSDFPVVPEVVHYGSLDAFRGSVINISGGTLGTTAVANPGSVVNISGGNMGWYFLALADTEVNVSGGNLGPLFSALPGSHVNFVGGEFQLNGVGYTGDNLTLGPEDVFTGTLLDGSTFIRSSFFDDLAGTVTLNRRPLPPPDVTPIIVDDKTDGPPSLREGQVLTVKPGGRLVGHVRVVDATLNVAGGAVGSDVVGSGLKVVGGTVNILAGEVEQLTAFTGSLINISGGQLRSPLRAFAGSQVNLFGTSFFLDGKMINPLELEETLTITERNVTLSGILGDGSLFSFNLATENSLANDVFNGTLTITLVPEPASLALLLSSLVFLQRRQSTLPQHER